MEASASSPVARVLSFGQRQPGYQVVAPQGSMLENFSETGKTHEEASDRIFTVPNIISFLRLCLIPVFLILLLNGHDIGATVVFAAASLTDCIDGFIARHFNQVSKLGQVLDPTVDRLLMISGAVGLILVGRLPVWIVVLVLLRDAVLLTGGSWLLKKWHIRVPVIFAGKVCTTLLFCGFAFLLLNWPRMNGLGWVEAAWLPGFNGAVCSFGIWLVYAGLALGVFTTAYYITKSILALHEAKANERAQTV